MSRPRITKTSSNTVLFVFAKQPRSNKKRKIAHFAHKQFHQANTQTATASQSAFKRDDPPSLLVDTANCFFLFSAESIDSSHMCSDIMTTARHTEGLQNSFFVMEVGLF